LNASRWVVLAGALLCLAPYGARAQVPVRLVLGNVVQRVDGSSGEDVTEFGTVNGGTLSITGIGIVVDRVKNRLVVLAPGAGTYRVTTRGRTGSGPGEFRYPATLRWFDWGTLAALDSRLSRLSYFAISEVGLRHLRDETLRELPTDFCFLNGRLVTLRYDPVDRSILHWAASEKQPALSTGLPFLQGNPRSESMTSRGLLLCLPDLGMVVVASMYSGEVRGYGAAGGLLWHTTFADFMPLSIREFPGGGLAFVGQKQGKDVVDHLIVSLLRVDPDKLMVQFGLAVLGKHRFSDLTFAKVETRFLQLRDGASVGAQSDLPVVWDLNRELALVAGGEPAPWVELRRYRIVGSR